MPKSYTFPTLYNEALQIHISKLKGWGYLDPNQIKSGRVNWSRNGNPTGQIWIEANTHSEKPYIELDYKFKGEPRNYKVYLVSIPSNLNRGKVWYFICPHTNKRCRVLYSIGGYFYHRTAFVGCMYEKQTQTKKYRVLEKTLGAYFQSNQLYDQLYRKHLKKQYAGKPTKKYLRLTQQIQKAESIPYEEIERAMIR